MFDFLKKKEEPRPALPAPLNLRLGSAVELDLLPFQMLSNQLEFELPDGVQTIEAAGFIDLGAGAALSRFYTADDGFIQVSTTGGYETANINDIKLFVFEQTENIASQRGVDLWVSDSGKIGRPEFVLENRVYQRVWDAEVPGKIEPVKLTEEVHTKTEGTYEVDHLAMLYQRQVPESKRYEYVLASLEFTSEDEATSVVSLGVDLDLTSISVM